MSETSELKLGKLDTYKSDFRPMTMCVAIDLTPDSSGTVTPIYALTDSVRVGGNPKTVTYRGKKIPLLTRVKSVEITKTRPQSGSGLVRRVGRLVLSGESFFDYIPKEVTEFYKSVDSITYKDLSGEVATVSAGPTRLGATVFSTKIAFDIIVIEQKDIFTDISQYYSLGVYRIDTGSGNVENSGEITLELIDAISSCYGKAGVLTQEQLRKLGTKRQIKTVYGRSIRTKTTPLFEVDRPQQLSQQYNGICTSGLSYGATTGFVVLGGGNNEEEDFRLKEVTSPVEAINTPELRKIVRLCFSTGSNETMRGYIVRKENTETLLYENLFYFVDRRTSYASRKAYTYDTKRGTPLKDWGGSMYSITKSQKQDYMPLFEGTKTAIMAADGFMLSGQLYFTADCFRTKVTSRPPVAPVREIETHTCVFDIEGYDYEETKKELVVTHSLGKTKLTPEAEADGFYTSFIPFQATRDGWTFFADPPAISIRFSSQSHTVLWDKVGFNYQDDNLDPWAINGYHYFLSTPVDIQLYRRNPLLVPSDKEDIVADETFWELVQIEGQNTAPEYLIRVVLGEINNALMYYDRGTGLVPIPSEHIVSKISNYAGVAGVIKIVLEGKPTELGIGAVNDDLYVSVYSTKQTQEILKEFIINEVSIDVPSYSDVFSNIREPLFSASMFGSTFGAREQNELVSVGVTVDGSEEAYKVLDSVAFEIGVGINYIAGRIELLKSVYRYTDILTTEYKPFSVSAGILDEDTFLSGFSGEYIEYRIESRVVTPIHTKDVVLSPITLNARTIRDGTSLYTISSKYYGTDDRYILDAYSDNEDLDANVSIKYSYSTKYVHTKQHRADSNLITQSFGSSSGICDGQIQLTLALNQNKIFLEPFDLVIFQDLGKITDAMYEGPGTNTADSVVIPIDPGLPTSIHRPTQPFSWVVREYGTRAQTGNLVLKYRKDFGKTTAPNKVYSNFDTFGLFCIDSISISLDSDGIRITTNVVSQNPQISHGGNFYNRIQQVTIPEPFDGYGPGAVEKDLKDLTPAGYVPTVRYFVESSFDDVHWSYGVEPVVVPNRPVLVRIYADSGTTLPAVDFVPQESWAVFAKIDGHVAHVYTGIENVAPVGQPEVLKFVSKWSVAPFAFAPLGAATSGGLFGQETINTPYALNLNFTGVKVDPFFGPIVRTLGGIRVFLYNAASLREE